MRSRNPFGFELAVREGRRISAVATREIPSHRSKKKSVDYARATVAGTWNAPRQRCGQKEAQTLGADLQTARSPRCNRHQSEHQGWKRCPTSMGNDVSPESPPTTH